MIKGKGHVFILGSYGKICDVEYSISEKPRREGQTRMFITVKILDDYQGFIELKDYVLMTENGKYLDIRIIDTHPVAVGGRTYNFNVGFPHEFRSTLNRNIFGKIH